MASARTKGRKDNKMKQSEFISLFAKRNDYTKQDAAIIVRDFIDTLTEVMVSGEEVAFRGFGSFEIKEHKGRTGYSVNTGKTKEFPSFMAPKFTASDSLKAQIKKKCKVGN